MRTLKYAILGLLMRQSLSGYELSKTFQQSVGNFWHANHSQIYPELKKLLEEELVAFHVEISGEVLEKKIYTITEKGREDFLDWLAQESLCEPAPKEIFRLRMFFNNHLEDAQVLQLVQNQREQRLDRLCALRTDLQKFDGKPGKHTPEWSEYMIIQGAILREESVLQWLALYEEELGEDG